MKSKTIDTVLSLIKNQSLKCEINVEEDDIDYLPDN